MEGPKTTPAPKPAAAPKKGGGRLGMVITVVAAVAVVALLAGYYPRLVGIWLLKPWDKSGPVEAVDSFAAALKAGDVTALQAVATDDWEFGQEGGRVTTIKNKEQTMRPPTDASKVTPSGSAKDGEIKYVYSERRRSVILTLTEPDGRRMMFTVVPREGKWLVASADG